jgi:predicted nuclease of predicted toxin-antitoxin system
MNLAILVDMNLSPDWVPVLIGQGWRTIHWSSVGDPRAADQVIMAWALANDHIVFTHDLDFGTALALAHAAWPSVIQIRGQDVLPGRMGSLVIAALRQHEADLAAGALLVVDERRCRVRVLPLTVANNR